MITIKYLADLQGAEGYGTCSSCGEDSKEDSKMVKVEFNRVHLGEWSCQSSIFLCDKCRREMYEKI